MEIGDADALIVPDRRGKEEMSAWMRFLRHASASELGTTLAYDSKIAPRLFGERRRSVQSWQSSASANPLSRCFSPLSLIPEDEQHPALMSSTAMWSGAIQRTDAETGKRSNRMEKMTIAVPLNWSGKSLEFRFISGF